MLEIPDVEHGQLELDVAVVAGAVNQQLAEGAITINRGCASQAKVVVTSKHKKVMGVSS